MKKTILLIMLAFMLTIMKSSLIAEDVMGCPKGIMKGTIWPRIDINYFNASEKYDFDKGKMVDIKSGTGLQKQTKKVIGFRFGYGLLKDVDLGILTKYTYAEVGKLKQNVYKKTEEGALTDLWLSGKYMFLDKRNFGPFYYAKFSLGAGYKIPICKDEDLIIKSVSNGADELKVGFLHHEGLGIVELAGHLLYIYRGTAKKILDNNGNPAYGKSDIDLADRFNYMVKAEYDLYSTIGIGVGISGWINFGDEATWQKKVSEWKKMEESFYSHAIHLSLEFRPFGLDYEKRKIFFHLGIPYSVKNNARPDYTIKVGTMYTF